MFSKTCKDCEYYDSDELRHSFCEHENRLTERYDYPCDGFIPKYGIYSLQITKENLCIS